MENNHYEVLGIPHDAAATIVKIAYEGRLRALKRSAAPEAEKAADERMLERAYATLSNPAKRRWYDNQLAAAEAKARKGGTPWGLIASAAIAVALVGGISWYAVERGNQRERMRLEEQRIALEQEKVRQQAELARERLASEEAARERTLQYRREVDARNQLDRDRRMDSARQVSEERQQAHAFTTAHSILVNEERERQRAEERDRREAEMSQRRAQAEVERQKRFVAEREREEERVRRERHYRVQQEEAMRSRQPR